MPQGRPAPLILEVVSERQALARVGLDALRGETVAPPGAWAVAAPERVVTPAGETDGDPVPGWVGGVAVQGEITIARAHDVVLAPRSGVLIDSAGQVFQSTAGELLSWKPDLKVLPRVRAAGDSRLFDPPAGLPRLTTASVFMAKGGEFNYGHFLLDCLPALLALDRQGLTARFPPVAGRLSGWRRDLLAMAFPQLSVRELSQPLVRIDEAAFASPMDHFLHRPNLIVGRLRERILDRAPAPAGQRRIYVSRRAYPMRVMVNEPELERALEARGFLVVRPERLKPAEQIALMRGAEVVVGATGAGLANGLFAPEGAQVFEILPEIFAAPWLRDVLHVVGVDWRGYFCPAPVSSTEVSWAYRIRRGFRWGYRLPLADFLRFLDARI